MRGLDSWIEGDNYCTYCGKRTCDCPPECPECGHPPHRGECTVERGDSYQSGFAPMALGPCGCTYQEDDEVERIRESDYDARAGTR